MILARHYHQILAASLCIPYLLVQAPTVQAQTQPTDVNLRQSAEAKVENSRKFVAPHGAFSIVCPGIPTISQEVVDSPGLRFTMQKYELRTSAQPPAGSPQERPEAKPQNWQRFSSTEGRFTIEFPGTPKVSETVINSGAERLFVHRVELRTEIEYVVMYADYPKYAVDMTTAEVLLEERVKGAVAEANSQLLSVSKLPFQNYTGRLIRDRMPDGTMRHALMILAGQRLYQVWVITPKEDGSDPAAVGFYNMAGRSFIETFEVSAPKSDNSSAVKYVTEDVLLSRAISLPQPQYPAIARVARASGIVEVQILVDEQGRAVSAHGISGHPLLQAEAVRAARQGEFTPMFRDDNKPVKMAGIIRYSFVAD